MPDMIRNNPKYVTHPSTRNRFFYLIKQQHFTVGSNIFAFDVLWLHKKIRDVSWIICHLTLFFSFQNHLWLYRSLSFRKTNKKVSLSGAYLMIWKIYTIQRKSVFLSQCCCTLLLSFKTGKQKSGDKKLKPSRTWSAIKTGLINSSWYLEYFQQAFKK